MTNKLSYGIDFGTTNSTIAIVDRSGSVKQLPIDRLSSNPAIMRSVIFADDRKSFLYGSAAVTAYIASVADNKASEKKIVNTGRFIKVSSDSSAKSGFKPDKIVPEIIETDVSSSGRLFQGIKSVLSSKMLSQVSVFDLTLSIEELVGHFLTEIKERADQIVGESVTRAVVGRPAKYVGGNNAKALERMEKALRFAGFTEFVFEYEPVGAALDYGIETQSTKTIMVFDFGGGTLDITVVNLDNNKVLSTVGLPIGGDYFNSVLFTSYIAPHFGSHATFGLNELPLPQFIFDRMKHWFQISQMKTEEFFSSLDSFKFLSSDPGAIQALKALIQNNLGFALYEEIEDAKKLLSTRDEVNYSFIHPNISINEVIIRNYFESLISDDLLQIKAKIEEAMQAAGVEASQIDTVVTTGGSSLIPVVRSTLSSIFGPEKLKSKDTFTSVASGLALKAHRLFG